MQNEEQLNHTQHTEITCLFPFVVFLFNLKYLFCNLKTWYHLNIRDWKVKVKYGRPQG